MPSFHGAWVRQQPLLEAFGMHRPSALYVHLPDIKIILEDIELRVPARQDDLRQEMRRPAFCLSTPRFRSIEGLLDPMHLFDPGKLLPDKEDVQ